MTTDTNRSVLAKALPSVGATVLPVIAVAIFAVAFGLIAPSAAKADLTGYMPDYDYSYNYVDDNSYDYSYSYADDYGYDYSYNYVDEWYEYDSWYEYEDYSYSNDYYSYESDYYYDDYDYEPYYVDYSYDYYDYDYCDYGCNSGCNSGCNPQPKPEPVCALSASDTSIEEGDDVELYWTSEYATSATLSSFGSVATGGNRSVSPNHDTTYTLTVRGNGGTDTCSVHINVEEEDEDNLWCELDVSDSRVDEGDEVTLEWDARGAVRASINEGIGRVDEDGGEEEVEVDEDTTFRLTVEDEDGDEETCTASVRVDEEDDFSSISFDGEPVNNPPTVYLSQLPYTGIEDMSPSLIASMVMLAALAGIGGYFFFLKRRTA